MAAHRPLVLQMANNATDPLLQAIPFKDGYRVDILGVMHPNTFGRAGLYRPEEWEHRVLGKGSDWGIAVAQWIYDLS